MTKHTNVKLKKLTSKENKMTKINVEIDTDVFSDKEKKEVLFDAIKGDILRRIIGSPEVEVIRLWMTSQSVTSHLIDELKKDFVDALVTSSISDSIRDKVMKFVDRDLDSPDVIAQIWNNQKNRIGAAIADEVAASEKFQLILENTLESLKESNIADDITHKVRLKIEQKILDSLFKINYYE